MKSNRRKFLAGVGGATLALPLLEKLEPTAYAQPAASHPRRIICLSYGMGTAMAYWRPEREGFDFTLPSITNPLTPYRDRCLFVSNIDQRVTAQNRRSNAGHPAQQQATLTGTLPHASFQGDRSNRVENVMRDGPEGSNQGAANGESVETFIGRAFERMHGGYSRSSIDLAVHGRSDRSEELIDSTFFHAAQNTPVSMLGNPVTALDNVFRDVTPSGEMPDPAVRARRLRQQSALDGVRDAFVELRAGLPNHDRIVLDNHAERIRQIELDVERLACSRPDGAPRGMGTMAQTSPIQMSIMANAMGCNLAPVGRLQFTNQHNPDFGVPDVDDFRTSLSDGQGWHAMVHREVMSSTGRRSGPTREESTLPYELALLNGYQFFVQQMAVLMDELASIPEGADGTLLDNTLVLLCSEYGNGHGHTPRKQAWALGGNLGDAHHGYHLDCSPPDRPYAGDGDGNHHYAESTRNTNHMLTSIIRMCGVTNEDGSEVDEFGLQGFASGTLPVFG